LRFWWLVQTVSAEAKLHLHFARFRDIK